MLLYNCMIGDATLFSRTDLVETAWRVAQPMLDTWAGLPMGDDSTYPAGSWGPPSAFDLIERTGRRWMEIVNRDILARIPLCSRPPIPVCLHQLAMMLEPQLLRARRGNHQARRHRPRDVLHRPRPGRSQFDAEGKILSTMSDGEHFGELSLLLSIPRGATVKAATPSDIFVLEKHEFDRVMRDHPDFASTLKDQARKRYNLAEGSL